MEIDHKNAMPKDHKKTKTRIMKHFSKTKFLLDVFGICWRASFQQTDDIDILVNHWSSLFSFVIEKEKSL